MKEKRKKSIKNTETKQHKQQNQEAQIKTWLYAMAQRDYFFLFHVFVGRINLLILK